MNIVKTLAIVAMTLGFSEVNAASVLSSSTISPDPAPTEGPANVVYEFVLEDNNSAQHTMEENRTVGAGVNIVADRLSRYPIMLQIAKENEVSNAFSAIGETCTPLFTEISPNNFQKTTPDWQTWDQLAQALAWPILSDEDMLNILVFEPCWTNPQFTTTDKRRIMNDASVPQVNEVNSDMANATNIISTLDAYVPKFDDEGNFLP